MYSYIRGPLYVTLGNVGTFGLGPRFATIEILCLQLKLLNAWKWYQNCCNSNHLKDMAILNFWTKTAQLFSLLALVVCANIWTLSLLKHRFLIRRQDTTRKDKKIFFSWLGMLQREPFNYLIVLVFKKYLKSDLNSIIITSTAKRWCL